MTQRRENNQRVQIGAIGLLAVVLLVGLASFANQRASNEVPVTEEIADTALPGAMPTAAADSPKEPLAELGAVPAPEATPAAKQ